MKKNVIIGQSGGPTAAINASLTGIIKQCGEYHENIDQIYGMIYGIEGFLQDNYLNLSAELSATDLEVLTSTPAAYLGSCRYKLPDDFSSAVYPAIFQKFAQLEIDYFFYIGGNDSMDTVSKLSRYARMNQLTIKIIGIPKTIDNDLVLTDHTPGFGSAAKYVAGIVRDIVMDASVYQQKSVTIIEIMGRHAGWLAAASILARKYPGDNPLFIYLPESIFDTEQFISKLDETLVQHSNIIVCVSEGIKDSMGRLICEYADDALVDDFGHKMLTGCSKYLENLVRNRLSIKVRSIELNVTQRCNRMMISATDIREAIQAGKFGVDLALSGKTGQMVAFKRLSDHPYLINYQGVDVNLVCNQEKFFPDSWITQNGTDISQAYLNYLLPLIEGEVIAQTENGLPVYCYRK